MILITLNGVNNAYVRIRHFDSKKVDITTEHRSQNTEVRLPIPDSRLPIARYPIPDT